MQPHRPIGIAILSVLWWIGAGVVCLSGLGTIVQGAALADVVGQLDGDTGGGVFVIFAIIGLLIIAFGVGIGATALGLWRLRAWAWWVAIVIYSVDLVLWLTILVATRGVPVYTLLVSIVVVGLIIAYLLTTGVREAFQVATAPQRRRRDEKATATTHCANQACGRLVETSWKSCPYCLAPAGGGTRRQAGAARSCTNPACSSQLAPGWRYCPRCLSPISMAPARSKA
jgi:hypothetical protein